MCKTTHRGFESHFFHTTLLFKPQMLRQSQNNITTLLQLSSVNKNSLKSFVLALHRTPVLSVKTKIKGLKVRASLVSVLTSPHVNKSAQEQFNKKTYGTSLLVECYGFSKFLFVLKNLVSQISDVQIKMVIFAKPKRMSATPPRFDLNPDDYITGKYLCNTAEYLVLLESYGEIKRVRSQFFKNKMNLHL